MTATGDFLAGFSHLALASVPGMLTLLLGKVERILPLIRLMELAKIQKIAFFPLFQTT